MNATEAYTSSHATTMKTNVNVMVMSAKSCVLVLSRQMFLATHVSMPNSNAPRNEMNAMSHTIPYSFAVI